MEFLKSIGKNILILSLSLSHSFNYINYIPYTLLYLLEEKKLSYMMYLFLALSFIIYEFARYLFLFLIIKLIKRIGRQHYFETSFLIQTATQFTFIFIFQKFQNNIYVFNAYRLILSLTNSSEYFIKIPVKFLYKREKMPNIISRVNYTKKFGYILTFFFCFLFIKKLSNYFKLLCFIICIDVTCTVLYLIYIPCIEDKNNEIFPEYELNNIENFINELSRIKEQSLGTVSTKYEEVSKKFSNNNLTNNSTNDDKKFSNNLSNFYNYSSLFDISNFNKKVINQKSREKITFNSNIDVSEICKIDKSCEEINKKQYIENINFKNSNKNINKQELTENNTNNNSTINDLKNIGANIFNDTNKNILGRNIELNNSIVPQRILINNYINKNNYESSSFNSKVSVFLNNSIFDNDLTENQSRFFWVLITINSVLNFIDNITLFLLIAKFSEYSNNFFIFI